MSLHGCYVEAQATYPAGTTLHMKLEASGVRLETKGNVRVTYPYLGMGSPSSKCPKKALADCTRSLAKISRPTTIMGPGVASSLPAGGPLRGDAADR